MKAIILAGGAGRRIFPFDRNRQKCFLPVGNVPNAVRQIRLLNALGIDDITVLTGHASDWAAYCLRDTAVSLVHDGGRPGAALADLADPKDNTLILYGDIYLTRGDLALMTEKPGKSAVAAALLQPVPSGYDKGSRICADAADGAVKAFFGHPRPHYVNTRSCGVFLLTPEAARFMCCAPPVFLNVPTGGMPPAGFWIENGLQTAIADGASVEARFAGDDPVDIDYPWDLLEANMRCAIAETAEIKGPHIAPDATVHPSASVERVRVGKRSVIGAQVLFQGSAIVGDDTVIQNGVIVGDGCVIGDHCVIENFCKLSPNTVVGDRCKIGFTAEISGVLMDGVSAVHNCELYGVVGRDTDIGAGTTSASLRFDDKTVARSVDGRTHAHPLASAVFIGDNARTGINCALLPGACVGGNTCIGPGVTAGGTVGHGVLLMNRQEAVETPWGPEKYGW